MLNENRYHVFVEGSKVDELKTWDDAVKVARIRQPAIIQDRAHANRARARTWAVAAMYDEPVYMGGQPAVETLCPQNLGLGSEDAQDARDSYGR